MGKVSFSEIMTCYKDNEIRWRGLVETYKRSCLIPFVGAGMSVPIFPTWKAALIEMLVPSEEDKAVLETLFNNNQYEEAAMYVKNGLGNGFLTRLNEIFSSYKIESVEKMAKIELLAELFKGTVFTTNFDEALEFFFDRSNNSFKKIYALSNIKDNGSIIIESVRKNTHTLFKIHGDIKDNNSLVFTNEQYTNVYGSENFTKGIEEIYMRNTFLFLGCSLSGRDRYISILKKVVADYNSKGINIVNYAFMECPEKDGQLRERERELNDWGISPIWFPHSKFESIDILLKRLKGEK